MKKRKKIVLCVIAAALAVSILAGILLSGSGNGYEKTFEAAEKLLFETDNFTMELAVNVRMDDKELGDLRETLLYDRGNRYTKDIEKQGDLEEVSEQYTIGDTRYYAIDHEAKTYLMYNTGGGSAPEDAFILPGDAKSVWNFGKLFADFLSGNVKNRFVREKIENGNRYSVSVSHNQLPEAFLQLSEIISEAFTYDAPTGVYIDYEDYNSTFFAYCLETMGEMPDEDFFDFYYRNDALDEAYGRVSAEMKERYKNLAESPEAYIYVTADGKAQVYKNSKEYYKTFPVTQESFQKVSINKLMRDMTVDRIDLWADVDKDGNLRAAALDLTIGFYDLHDKKHTIEIIADMSLTGFGTTEIGFFPPEGYTAGTKPIESYTSEEVTKTVRFDGVEYTVTYFKWVKE